MKKIIVLFFLMGVAISQLFAQTDSTSVSIVEIQEQKDSSGVAVTENSSNVLNDFLVFVMDRSKKSDTKHRGLNYAGWRFESYFGFGFMAGPMENSEAKMISGESYSIDFGLKSRYQFTGIYSLTFNVGFMHNLYKIANGRQDNTFSAFIPYPYGNFVVNNERFRTWAFGLSLGHRFNYSKTRGVKNYVEASLYGNYAFSRNYITNYTGDNNGNATMYYRNTSIFNPFEAGAQVNFGFHWFSIWGRYRLTDWFNSGYTDVKLPRFVIGAAFNIY